MRRIRIWWLVCCSSSLAWAQVEPADAPVPAGPNPVAQAQAAAAAAAPAASRWRLPPLAFGGSIAYDLRHEGAQDQNASRVQLVTLNLAAATYIYQPWLATVNARLGMTQADSTSSEDTRSSDRFTTGGLQLTVFPRSRFPAELRYEVTDSRTDSNLSTTTDLGFTSRLFALNQRYRPVNGEFTVTGGYERRTQEGASFGEDVQQQLQGDFTGRWKQHAVNVNFARTLNERLRTAEESSFATLAARHTFNQGDTLTVESGVNWAHNADTLLTGSNDVELAQATVVLAWRPTDKPYSAGASLRALSLKGGNGNDIDSLSASVGGTYEITPQLRVAANTTLTRQNGETRGTWNGNINANYQAPTTKFGEWDHDWFSGAALTGSRSGERADQTLSTQLGHTLGRVWKEVDGNTFSTTFSQTLNLAYLHSSLSDAANQTPASDRGLTRSVMNTGSLNWSRSSDAGTAVARLSASDVRQFDGDRARFQLLNFQVSGGAEFSRYASLTGDLSVQRVFQRTPTTLNPVDDPFGFNRQVTHSASGELSFRHTRAFGVPRLRFTSRLRAAGDAQRSTLAPVTDREDYSWENRLEYQVGRLESGVVLRLGQADGLWRRTVTLRLQRNFGE